MFFAIYKDDCCYPFFDRNMTQLAVNKNSTAECKSDNNAYEYKRYETTFCF